MLSSQKIEQLTTLRKMLHANPELSSEEYNTQKHIVQFLESETTASIQKVANTGVMATFDSAIDGPTTMIRGDIDALPITEINDFEHQSTSKGTSHKCGHDGHTCMLLGLALVLSNDPYIKGQIILLFQPAEENGMGAQAVLKDNAFTPLNIDFAFALHNLPGFPMHEIVVKENVFTGNVKSLIIKLNGKTSHAAEPEKGINPSLAIADILHFANKITRNDVDSPDFFLATPIHLNMGKLAYGISAGYGEVHLTIRSWSLSLMEQKSEALVNFIQKTCAKYQIESDISWTQVFTSNLNNPKAVQHIRTAATANNFKLTEPTHPFKWGEDFGLFTQKFKGAMFGVGAGIDTPALHNPDYDFPDEIIPTGIAMFYQIIKSIN